MDDNYQITVVIVVLVLLLFARNITLNINIFLKPNKKDK